VLSPLGSFMYAGGSAGTNATYRANADAFNKWGIIPRMLVDATTRNLEVCEYIFLTGYVMKTSALDHDLWRYTFGTSFHSAHRCTSNFSPRCRIKSCTRREGTRGALHLEHGCESYD